MTKFTVRVALLEAMQKFCAEWDSPNQALSCIHITPTHMIATNGHRLVCMPIAPVVPADQPKLKLEPRITGTIDEPFLMPGHLVETHVAAARELWEEWDEGDADGDEYRVDFLHALCEVNVDEGVARIVYDGITMSAPRPDLKHYPDTSKLEKTLTTEGAPVVARFNPALLVDVPALLEASNDLNGVALHAWDAAGTGAGPTEWRSYFGTRVIVMGMATSAADAVRAQKLHADVIAGKAVTS